jgi:hypothetical protein
MDSVFLNHNVIKNPTEWDKGSKMKMIDLEMFIV